MYAESTRSKWQNGTPYLIAGSKRHLFTAPTRGSSSARVCFGTTVASEWRKSAPIVSLARTESAQTESGQP